MCQFNLRGSDGDFLEFRVVGYRYPDESLEPSEDNPVDDFDTGRFLIVECRFKHNGTEWRRTGVILTTDDIVKLRDWVSGFDSIKSGKVGCYFTERDLELSYDGGLKVLTIYVSNDFNSPLAHPSSPTSLAFPLDDQNRSSLIEQLKKLVIRYPGRPVPM